jgi:hypothetical protein
MAAADEQLAQTLGLPTKRVAALRAQLPEGEAWMRGEDGRVVWLPAGEDALRASLGVAAAAATAEAAAPDPESDPEKTEGGGEPDGEVRLRVARLMPNPTWVAVDVGGHAVPVRVRPAYRPAVGRLIRCERRNGALFVTDPSCKP